MLGVLLAVFAIAIAAWRSLRGVPRASGVTFVLLGLLLASLRVAAAFRVTYWAVALVFPVRFGLILHSRTSLDPSAPFRTRTLARLRTVG